MIVSRYFYKLQSHTMPQALDRDNKSDISDNLKTRHSLQYKLLYTAPQIIIFQWQLQFNYGNKKAVLSQRWPRNAPYIWAPWKFSGHPVTMPTATVPNIFMGFCSDRPYECSYKIWSP